jgi:hypothetical protein
LEAAGGEMSFYSSLVLAANEGVRPPTPEAIRSLLGELGLLDPRSADDEFGNLAAHVADLFRDPAAHAENDHFFCPDSVGLLAEVTVQSPDGDYTGPGWCVTVHGNGYFFPWELADLRGHAIRSPALARLRDAVEARFGGRFVFPPADEELLRARLIDWAGGWAWFASESV